MLMYIITSQCLTNYLKNSKINKNTIVIKILGLFLRLHNFIFGYDIFSSFFMQIWVMLLNYSLTTLYLYKYDITL